MYRLRLLRMHLPLLLGLILPLRLRPLCFYPSDSAPFHSPLSSPSPLRTGGVGERLFRAPNGTRLTTRCHFREPKKVSISRAQPLSLALVMVLHASNTLHTVPYTVLRIRDVGSQILDLGSRIQKQRIIELFTQKFVTKL
jgi:hypothetical protein